MFFEIEYKIKYNYSKPVFLESNEIRIFPRNDLTQKLLDYSINIAPSPASKTFLLDFENNTVLKTWFNGLNQNFEITFNCKVQTLRDNPYDFIVDTENTELPVNYSADIKKHLNNYLDIKKESRLIKDFSDEIKKEAGNNTLKFLTLLSERIHSDFTYQLRKKGYPLAAEETFARKTGSCRDFAVLYMEACRYQGLAARFVSGYQFDEDCRNCAHLHAWTEVYIPGGGWRGYDPVNGIAVANRHIPVVSSCNPSETLPIIGSYRGNDAECDMDYNIRIRTL